MENLEDAGLRWKALKKYCILVLPWKMRSDDIRSVAWKVRAVVEIRAAM